MSYGEGCGDYPGIYQHPGKFFEFIKFGNFFFGRKLFTMLQIYGKQKQDQRLLIYTLLIKNALFIISAEHWLVFDYKQNF